MLARIRFDEDAISLWLLFWGPRLLWKQPFLGLLQYEASPPIDLADFGKF